MAHLLGIDLGSSSVKVSLFDAESMRVLATAQSPADREMHINAAHPAWAEQDPEAWWQHTLDAIQRVHQQVSIANTKAIGIAYQMHGLVILDEAGQPLRPAIIWCDSRAVAIGHSSELRLGTEYLSNSTLNSPGNFTASKWAWVARNEPELLEKAHTVMLPGDYLAFRLSGQRATTASGLSEMALLDFQNNRLASTVLEDMGLNADLLPPIVPTFGQQARVSETVAREIGFKDQPWISYRAGDQPNNAFSLNVLHPGEVAATAGTSGVVYAVAESATFDERQRINAFAHVNHSTQHPHLGLLLCVNGTGVAYAWLRRMLGAAAPDLPSYSQLNDWAAQTDIGSKGLRFYPFGNGAERMLGNREPGARFDGLSLTRHGVHEICNAVQEGIAAALAYGVEVFGDVGLTPTRVRAGRANMFLSDRFCQHFCQLLGTELELYDTDGAQGAARGAGLGAGVFSSAEQALSGLQRKAAFSPDPKLETAYAELYGRWKAGISL